MQSGWCCYLRTSLVMHTTVHPKTFTEFHRHQQASSDLKSKRNTFAFSISLTLLAVFMCCPTTYRSISYVRQKVSFSIFLFSHPFHSVSSFTVCWALDGDSVCWRGTALDVCLCVYIKVHHGVDPGWCDISLFAWLFFLCMFLQLSGRCVHGYICGENKCRSGVKFSIITFLCHVSLS